MKMKALAACNMGPNSTYVKRGAEFEVANEHRAAELEEAGLAYRLHETPVKVAAVEQVNHPENKAAEKGPLPKAGGETGEMLSPAKPKPKRQSLSLRRGHQQKKKT